MYIDCFNKENADADYIGAMLPGLIIFPETSNILRRKNEAASSVFTMIWKDHVLIEKDDNHDGGATDNFNNAFMDFVEEDR